MTRQRIARAAILALALLVAAAAARGAGPPRVLAWDEVVGEPGALGWPVAVASASADELAVADVHDSRLVVLERKSGSWSVRAVRALDGAPRAVAHDGVRYAVSLRGGAGLVAVEGPELELRRIALPAGAQPGALAAVPGGGFLVYDYHSTSVIHLDVRGAAAGRTPVEGHVTGLAASPGGGFFAAIADRAELAQYGANGTPLRRWSLPGVAPVPAWPSGIALEPGGDLILADRHNGRLLVVDTAGGIEGVGSRRGWEPGLLRFPAGVTVGADGRVVVADEGNGRVQIFSRIAAAEEP
jgi:hypothetical protein